MVKGYAWKDARKAKVYLLRKGVEADFVQSILLSWFKLKVLHETFGKRYPVYGAYIAECRKRLFYLDEQEEYSLFLEHYLGESAFSEAGVLGPQPQSALGDAYKKESVWRPFFGGDNISPAYAIPLSFFPLWKLDKPSKTKEVGNLPYDESNEPEFRTLIREFLSKYAPDSIVIPSMEACYNPTSKRYSDGGEVRRDFELPKNGWTGEFVVQSFLTGPLTEREVWLPPRMVKLNNTFWFCLIKQIIRNVPYYANNYDTPEELHNAIKHKIKGTLMNFDITGFGLQYPRSMLGIIADEIQLLYYKHWALDTQVDQLKDILNDVLVKFPDGTYMTPTRGIGLGYYETMKTIGVLAILDRTDPVAIFGDQGIVPFSMRTRKFSPREALPKFGFYFDPTKIAGQAKFQSAKTRLLPNCETGIILAGCFMTPEHCVQIKSAFAPLSGALNGEYHWERKQAILSCTYDTQSSLIERYIPFLYELAFGCEFYPSESTNHPRNLGLAQSAIPTIGLTRYTNVLRLISPRVDYDFKSIVHPFAHRTLPVDRKAARHFHVKRKRAYKANVLTWTLHYDSINPTIKMNRTKRAALPNTAKDVPWWLAVRELVINNIDRGKITHGLVDNHDLTMAITRHNLAENPFEARATGGYTITSANPEKFGIKTEHLEIVRAILQARRNEIGLTVYRRDRELPSHAVWDEQLPKDKLEHLHREVRHKNPYLMLDFKNELVGDLLADDPDASLDLVKHLKDQLANIPSDLTSLEESWDDMYEHIPEEDYGVTTSDADYGDLMDNLEDLYADPREGLRSPSPTTDEPMIWAE